MYTKTGLSLLAIAGLAVGVIGMQAGGATAGTKACVAPSSTAPAAAAAGSAASTTDVPSKNAAEHHRKATSGHTSTAVGAHGTKNSTGIISVGTGTNAGTGSGTTAPGTTAPTSPSSSDSPFLVVNGTTNTGSETGGTAPVPPTGTHVVGRSHYLGSLINVRANGDAGH